MQDGQVSCNFMAGALIKPPVDVVSKQEEVNVTRTRRGRNMKTLTERARSEREYILVSINIVHTFPGN